MKQQSVFQERSLKVLWSEAKVLSGKGRRQRNHKLKSACKENVKSQTSTCTSLIVEEVVHLRKQRLAAVALSREYRDLFICSY